MSIAPIKTEADYETALAELDRLVDAEPNTPRGDWLGDVN
jgi:HTH-type transcriptional regulator/antitoxin HigA